MSTYETYVIDAYEMNVPIIIDGLKLQITGISEDGFHLSVHDNEKLIYVTLMYQEDMPFSSQEFTILLENDDVLEAYLIDGIDYLKTEGSYMRFSVPEDTYEAILIYNEDTYIHLTWE
jgi:hypothetical protein